MKVQVKVGVRCVCVWRRACVGDGVACCPVWVTLPPPVMCEHVRGWHQATPTWARGSDTRLDAATTAGCRRAAWVAGCRRGGHGRRVGEGGCRSASVRPGKGCGAEHVCCSPRCRFGSGKTSGAAEGASSGGKGWKRRSFAWWCRVQECGVHRSGLLAAVVERPRELGPHHNVHAAAAEDDKTVGGLGGGAGEQHGDAA